MTEIPDPDAKHSLGPEAFKKLYPEQYYKRFIESGIRPDGRTFGRARPATIGLGAVSTADSSALVKIGSTTVLAGIKLEVKMRPAPPGYLPGCSGIRKVV